MICCDQRSELLAGAADERCQLSQLLLSSRNSDYAYELRRKNDIRRCENPSNK